MKLKPLQNLIRSKEEARKIVEQTAQWHVPSPNLPQNNGVTIQINLPPIVIRTESQQLSNHQTVLTGRHTLQFPAGGSSSDDFLTNIPESVPDDFLTDIPV